MIRRLLPIPLVLLAVALPGTAEARPGACPGADAVPHSRTLDGARSATLCLINRQRTSRGLHPLRHHPLLRRAADRFARDMVRHRFFDHVSAFDGSSVATRVRATSYLRGAAGWLVGENIAWGSGSYATPRHTVTSWMRSPGHRANILSPRFREIGVGISRGAPAHTGAPAATYATDFARR